MGRIFTSGFECNQTGTNSAEGWLLYSTKAAITAGAKRSGAYGLDVNMDSAGYGYVEYTIATPLASGRTFYAGMALNVVTVPAALNSILDLWERVSIKLDTDGSLGLYYGGAPQTKIGSNSGVLSAGWHWVELSYSYTSGTLVGRLDGVMFASGTATTSMALAYLSVGSSVNENTNVASGRWYIDDVILNDDQGGSENNFPDSQHVGLLLPVSDNSRGTWVAGAGGTTNLYDAINNTPPAGVAAASETNTSNIKNLTTGSSNPGDFNMAAYNTVVTGGPIVCIQGIIRHGEHATSGTKAGLITIVSNPAQGANDTFNFGNDAGLHAAEINLWKTKYGTVLYAPSVTAATQPVMRVSKTTSSTGQACVSMMGILVSWKDLPTRQLLMGVGR